jgi:hypothetical protein
MLKTRIAMLQSLLANDDAAAALRQRLTSRQIGNVEYAKQAQDLTAARRAILSHYDRAGQRELTSLLSAIRGCEQLS